MTPQIPNKPTQKEAEQAIQTLLLWIGEDPEREGLIETPQRVLKAYKEHFSGYALDPKEVMQKTFSEVENYDEIVLLKDIDFVSHCEHHMAPVIGKAHIGYLPDNKVVGLSKLARLVDIFSKRLQTQEAFTAKLAVTIEQSIGARGVGVIIQAHHQCMTTRGIKKIHAETLTTRLLGAFRDDPVQRKHFMSLIALSL